MRVSRLLVLVLASLAALPPARSASSSGRDGNTDERLIGWLGEVERPAAEFSGEAALVDTDGDGEPETSKQWIEQIATAPRAYVWHGFMSPEECDHVIAAAEPLMERSGVVDSKTGAPAVDPIRTSYGAFLPIAHDEVVARIETRAAEWAMVPVTHQEQLHVLRYAEGQQYKDHHDAFDATVREKIAFDNGRQRLATVLMYLSDVDEGGETVFPHPSAAWSGTADRTGGEDGGWSACASRGPAAKPKKGDALLFYDLTLKGDLDDAATHAGCPRDPGREVDRHQVDARAAVREPQGSRRRLRGRPGERSAVPRLGRRRRVRRQPRVHGRDDDAARRVRVQLLRRPRRAGKEVAGPRDREAGATRDVRAVREGSRRVTRYFCFRFSG